MLKCYFHGHFNAAKVLFIFIFCYLIPRKNDSKKTACMRIKISVLNSIAFAFLLFYFHLYYQCNEII